MVGEVGLRILPAADDLAEVVKAAASNSAFTGHHDQAGRSTG